MTETSLEKKSVEMLILICYIWIKI